MEVHCQPVPRVSFRGQTLDNHAYMDLSLVGDELDGDDSDTVKCHTDLDTCCAGEQGFHRGDWYFPGGTQLPFSGDISEDRNSQLVDLRRKNNANSPVGIYRCDIATNAVHDDTDINVRDSPVYVGLYTTSGGTFAISIVIPIDILLSNSGDITISGSVTYDSDQFTLTCISTGGPATTVSWTRDNAELTEGTETVLNDPVTAQYTHTLTISLAGVYTCTVANSKPSSASASINVTGILLNLQ